MDQTNILINILLTIITGAVVGLESETREIAKNGKELASANEKSRIGGVRTYTLLSLLGGISGLFYSVDEKNIAYLIFIGVSVFLISAYIMNIRIKEAFGLTTEIAIIITFLLGFFITSSIVSLEIIMFILVLLAFFLSQKRGLGVLIEKIEHKEIIDILKFGLVSIVVLPLLPNTKFYLKDILNLINFNFTNDKYANLEIINPFSAWFIVILISGISILGYTFSKYIGTKRGLYLTGIFGGLVSSTATTISLAHYSKKTSADKLAAASSIIANSFSFISAFTVLSVSSRELAFNLLPAFALMFITGLIYSLSITFFSKSDSTEGLEIKYEPFSIIPAIKFVALIIFIKILIQIIQISDLSQFIILISSISGFTGLDATVIAIGDIFESKELSLQVAQASIIGANTVNFIAKMFYAKISGSEIFFKYLATGLFLSFLASLVIFIL